MNKRHVSTEQLAIPHITIEHSGFVSEIHERLLYTSPQLGVVHWPLTQIRYVPDGIWIGQSAFLVQRGASVGELVGASVGGTAVGTVAFKQPPPGAQSSPLREQFLLIHWLLTQILLKQPSGGAHCESLLQEKQPIAALHAKRKKVHDTVSHAVVS